MPIDAIEKPAVASEGLRPGTWLIPKPPRRPNGLTPGGARGWNRLPLPRFSLRCHTPQPRKSEMRGGYKRFFPRGLFQKRESGRYHLTGAVVRCADGFRIFKMKRMDDGVGNKKKVLFGRRNFERHLAW
jgi:hypothetical protein